MVPPVATATFASPQEAPADHRIRGLRIGTLAMFAIALPTVVRYWQLGLPLVACATVVTMATCTASLVLLQRTRRVDLCGNLSVAALYLLLVVSVWSSGGFYDPEFSWLYTVPVAAACLIDLRSGWVWTCVIALTTFAFWQAPELGVAVASAIPADQQAGQALFSRITAIIALSALSTSFVISQRRAERDLAEANRELVRGAMCVQLLEHAAVAANEANSFRHAFESCTEAVMAQTGWQVGHVWLPAGDGSGDFVSGSSWICSDPEHYAELQSLTNGSRVLLTDPDSALRRAIKTMQPVWAGGGNLASVDSPRGRVAARLGLRSAIAVPVPSSGEVIALIEFFGSDAAPIDERLIGVLADVGWQIGRVAERIRLHDRLRQSQKLESVGQLAAGIAHEINNPMAYVRANLGILRAEWAALSELAHKSDLPEEAQQRIADCEELIDESLEGVDRTVAIVRDVREFSHANEGATERVDLNDLLEGALRVSTPRQPANIVVERTYASLPAIDGSPGQLSQVFLNLIVNAYQVLPEGGTLRLSTEVVGSQVVIGVEDDGPGIAPEAADRLFDPFFTTKPAGEGTGLGLFVSYEIVRNHGGEIRVEAPPNGGTRFEVLLDV